MIEPLGGAAARTEIEDNLTALVVGGALVGLILVIVLGLRALYRISATGTSRIPWAESDSDPEAEELQLTH